MTNYKPLRSFKTKEEVDNYVRETLQSEGLEMIGSYKNNSTPIKVKIGYGEYKGYVGTVKWGNFIQGKRPDFRSLLDGEKERLVTDSFEAEGYKVVHIPKPFQVRDKIDLLSPEGYEWSVSYDTFRKGVRCPLDSDRSWGERCVSTILKENDIDFKAQCTIFYEDGTRQYMDFYIEYEGGKFDVEYNGRQHYQEERINQLFSSLEVQKEKDRRKKEYCANNGITYIEIPYTVREVNDIAKALKTYIPIIDDNREYVIESYRYDEKAIIDYYKTHTEKETARTFGISGSTVKNIAKRNKFSKKNGGSLHDYHC